MMDLEARLAELDGQGLRRRRRVLESAQGTRVTVDGKTYLSFASNDYLGLASHPAIAAAACEAATRYGVGAGASHLLTGHHALHQRLEGELAAFVGRPAALLFATGYMANLGVVTALVGRDGALFADRLNHASLVDAALLSRAEHVRYRHLDLGHLEELLRASRAKNKLIASDTVFSMDGDLAPVAKLLALAEKYNAWLYLDDAHGFGVLGEGGRGVLHSYPALLTPHPALIYLATLGKAAGVSGAFVAGSETLVEWLVNKARTYIYTTAAPPMLAAAVSASLKLIAGEPWRRQQLQRLMAQLKAGVARLPWPLLPSDSPIQPLLIGGNHEALRLADGLLERGILLPAIRPPTVPEGTARLRISLSAAHTEAELAQLLTALKELA
ncbi:MAG: 8-amino-7-oxononanoate synthase [Hydrogenophilales bacterium CG03_land_8_20_14_0_80_62_28]|nr:8-amino-7-oxononanoate synthase [Betaproteobacteria bacterium]OIO78653.1 MAG: 8-amino-7-oxononanoate synthase [Hydrogenophilaceae bacterium CG1_02_62_390]PIV22421.1 MAG: 8-amino-7-oxononanoate synthase [Hydrogenophilales bacterium CG03_land_8_20_14_0_80_62_28]PIW38101.1 MAG: 8-amino-7-oxononanoate synthase [Hydrogenophilales bacterium CG15_BIG_FIL_POST_REV_8_21_14_020_62_31]PIX01152.1 MAG: 8-amino-7-oxononanoate synthase [Hydrogenophilales bacterium CG_4_8_14_3_um_filter_62_83]PIY98204.1 MA